MEPQEPEVGNATSGSELIAEMIAKSKAGHESSVWRELAAGMVESLTERVWARLDYSAGFKLYPPGEISDVNVIALTKSWMSSNAPTEQIERVLELASNIFEDAKFAKDWLNRPNLATDEKAPVTLLGTEEGLARVETLLHRIEYGVLA